MTAAQNDVPIDNMMARLYVMVENVKKRRSNAWAEDKEHD